MSEETNEQATTETTTTDVPTPKAKAKPKPKAKKPVPKAKPKAKPANKAAKPKAETRPPRDNARKVAKASEGKLNTDQVRVLRALNGKGRPLTMAEVKKGCGLEEDAKYSGGFLKSLHTLQESRLIRTDKEQDERTHTYAITDKGTAALKKAEAALKAAA